MSFWEENFVDWSDPKNVERLKANSNRETHRSEEGITAARKRRTVAPIDPYCSDMDLCDLAARRADLMMELIAELRDPVTLEWINATLERLEAKPRKYEGEISKEQQLQGIVSRVCCEYFWRRQIRRAQVQKREAQEQADGYVCARNQPYVTDVTDSRYAQRQAANRAMLENTEIESQDGEVLTLWAAVQASTANKSIRRGELMTRIRGCEEWATAAGMVGIFTTNTLPSRFHASLFGGGINPNFQGDTPREGQQQLCKTWARTRAAIKRQGIKMFGFRVAEPHHDGCPHWHMLLWVSQAQVTRLTDIIRGYWLQDSGGEYGAQDARFKFESIDPARGGAVSYVAKYIAKNIDDAGSVGTEGHTDHEGDKQIELIEGGNKARRVTAWASAWGIRQFQAIGQPPVTVWRELRRIDEGMAAGASKALQAAHAAVNKVDDKRADWSAYMQAQGGAMTGRNYQLRLELDKEEKQGRYGVTEVARPMGVFDVARPGEICTSNRKKWAPRGTWTPQTRHAARVGDFGEVRDLYLTPLPTWTRVNNCTHPKYSEAEINRFAHSWQHEKQQSRSRGGTPTENLRV